MHVGNALIVGGGIAGMACAIQMRRAGIGVDLIERDPQWLVHGAGIAFTAPSLRAFKALGLLDEICAQGAFSDVLRLHMRDGTLIAPVDLPQIEAGVPNSAAIMRPLLAALMSARVRESGAHVRLGVTTENLSEQGDAVRVQFSDGAEQSYDLVVGADGMHSQLRAVHFPAAPAPNPTGQGCWRIVAARPPDVGGIELFTDGRTLATLFPVTASQLYLSVIDAAADDSRATEAQHVDLVRAILARFGGHAGAVRDSLASHAGLVYRPLEAVLVPPPWHKGRIVLVGDAVHGATPHIAAGGGMALEDALVLVEEIERGDDIESALTAFAARRFERCALVVNTAQQIGAAQMEGEGRPEILLQLMAMATARLSQPF
ncbi:MAG: FAD-dependent monooxygenase [Hyphomonadaceae bacterium]